MSGDQSVDTADHLVEWSQEWDASGVIVERIDGVIVRTDYPPIQPFTYSALPLDGTNHVA